MPGVLMVECGAQAAGALWASMRKADAPAHFVLSQVVQFRIQRAVLPQEIIETNVVLEKVFGHLAQFEVVLTVKQAEVARGRLVLGDPIIRPS